MAKRSSGTPHDSELDMTTDAVVEPKPVKKSGRRKIRIFDRSNSKKLGLPPGSVVPIGQQRDFTPFVTLIRFGKESYESVPDIDPENLAAALRAAPKEAPSEDLVTWVNVEGVHEPRVIQKVAELFELHALTQEDIVNTALRPQFESFPGYFFFAIKMLYINSEKEMIQEQVSMVLRGHTVITFQETPGDVFGRIRERCKTQTSKMRSKGADYLIYMLLDSIVDGYYQVIDSLNERIDALEDEMRVAPHDSHLARLFVLRRETLFLRKTIIPVRDMLNKAQVEGSVFHDNTLIYLKDLSDHVIQVTDSLNLAMEMTTVLIDTYHSIQNQRLNAVMKTLTMISTVFLPLNFIAGIYGMNFEHMPELKWTYGYPIVLFTMAVVVLSMLWFFIMKGWLWRDRNLRIFRLAKTDFT